VQSLGFDARDADAGNYTNAGPMFGWQQQLGGQIDAQDDRPPSFGQSLGVSPGDGFLNLSPTLARMSADGLQAAQAGGFPSGNAGHEMAIRNGPELANYRWDPAGRMSQVPGMSPSGMRTGGEIFQDAFSRQEPVAPLKEHQVARMLGIDRIFDPVLKFKLQQEALEGADRGYQSALRANLEGLRDHNQALEQQRRLGLDWTRDLGQLGVNQSQEQRQLAEANAKYSPQGRRQALYGKFIESGQKPAEAADSLRLAEEAGILGDLPGFPVGAPASRSAAPVTTIDGEKPPAKTPPVRKVYFDIEHQLNPALRKPTGKAVGGQEETVNRTVGEFLANLNATMPQGYVRQNWPKIEAYLRDKLGGQAVEAAKEPPAEVSAWDLLPLAGYGKRLYDAATGNYKQPRWTLIPGFGQLALPFASEQRFFTKPSEDEQGRSMLRQLLEGR
jgi:hypothetical protein